MYDERRSCVSEIKVWHLRYYTERLLDDSDLVCFTIIEHDTQSNMQQRCLEGVIGLSSQHPELSCGCRYFA